MLIVIVIVLIITIIIIIIIVIIVVVIIIIREPIIRPISLLRLSLLRTVDTTLPGEFPMGLRIPPLNIYIMLELNPLKSRILVRRWAVPNVDPRR